MLRTQIQLPEPLFNQLKQIAAERNWSVAELVRRGMEAYAQTCAMPLANAKEWTMPLLRGSGGHLLDPAALSSEADAMTDRFEARRNNQ